MARIRLDNVPPGIYRIERRAIGFERNDAYSAYLKMGAPVSGEEVKVGADGIFQTTLPMRENDVWLLSILTK